MKNIFKKSVKRVIESFGFEITRKNPYSGFPVELNIQEREFVSFVQDNSLSMVSNQRLFTTMMSCKHALERGIEGDFVECGVWRGGNALLAAAIFFLYKSEKRVYLFDTFEGMTKPTQEDTTTYENITALANFEKHQGRDNNEWAYASLEDVKNNFDKAGLLSDNIIFIKGDVLKTLEGRNLPSRIAVLRLDTDWYESTKKELEVLYPKVSKGGVLIIDDYGHWAGSKKATDEYFMRNGKRPFLQFTDYTGRAGIKFD